MRVADYVMQVIADQGVRQIFFLPGGGAMHLVDALGRNGTVEPVSMLHEQSAMIAAESYARVTGNLGVAMVTTGPGGTNAMTGVAAAWIESTPCLVVSGQVKRADLKGDSGVRQLGVQEVDITSLVRPITKYAVTVMEPESIRYHLEKALYLAKHGRPGPVWIDIPLDVQASQIDPDALPAFDAAELSAPSEQSELSHAVADALALLRTAKRPVMLAGNGVRLSGGLAAFRSLVEKLGIPVLTTRTNGLDLLPYDHPLYIGRPGAIASRAANFALQTADWLLVLGSRLDLVQVGYDQQHFAPNARMIMVDIDPTEIQKLKRTVDVPVVADVKAFMEAFTAVDTPQANEAWLQRCRDWKARYPVILPQHRDTTTGVSSYAFTERLCQLLPENATVVLGSSGASTEICTLSFQSKEGQRVFLTGGLGSMGFALPAGIGAAFAAGQQVVVVEGDGSLQLNIQDLATLAARRLPVTLFVLNNEGYGSIRNMQRNHFGGFLVGSDASSGLTLPDTCAVAAAYGLPTLRISSQAELHERLPEILSTPGPLICELLVSPDEVRMPTLSSKTLPDGRIVSAALEDLWPFLDRDEFAANMQVE